MRWNTRKHIYVSRQALIEFAWSAPMRDLAKKVGISDVGLRKLLKAHGVMTPPQGHWNRIHAGKKVAGPPDAPPRRPGETGRVRLDERFEGLTEEAKPIPVGGPFASKVVPENLGELRAIELAALDRFQAVRTLERPHPGLLKLLRREHQIRLKALEDKWCREGPTFDTALGQRKLKLLNALFFALEYRGHKGEAWEQSGELLAQCVIGDTRLHLSFSIVGAHRTEMKHGRQQPARDLPASTPLCLALNRELRYQTKTAWQDVEDGKLEARITEIAADIIVAGEASFRQSLIEAAEWEEQQRKWEEERQLQRLAELDKKRLENLRESGRLLAEANEIRALAAQVDAAVLSGETHIDPDELEAWKRWALGYADKIDPVRSGQVMTHILPPK